jgi:hypothetical protein
MIELCKQTGPAQNSVARMEALQKTVNSATLPAMDLRERVNGVVRINLDGLNTLECSAWPALPRTGSGDRQQPIPGLFPTSAFSLMYFC